MAKIMIVDDEPNILVLERAILESEGFEVVLQEEKGQRFFLELRKP